MQPASLAKLSKSKIIPVYTSILDHVDKGYIRINILYHKCKSLINDINLVLLIYLIVSSNNQAVSLVSLHTY